MLFIESNDEAKSYFGGLPGIYQQVEYIQSDGNQYLDSGIIGENKYILETKVLFTDTGSSSVDYCVLSSTGTSRPSYMSYIKSRGVGSGHYWSQMVGNDYQTATWSNVYANTEYTIKAKLSTSGNYLTVNGTTNTWNYGSSYNSGYSMYIFASNNGGTVGGIMMGRIYYLKIYDLNENLLHDYIPCYRKSDGVIGMFDTVEAVFLTNIGSGNFTKGGNV